MEGLSGIASGVDTSAIVDKLMSIERSKRERMDLRKAAITTRQTNLGTIQSKLLALRTATAGLRDVGTWADKQTVESSDTRVVAERTSGAGPGGYTVSVSQLARAEQRTYTFAPPAAKTTLTVGSTAVELEAGATVDDAVRALNGAAGSPVYATNVNDKLVLSARTTGTSSAFTATGSMLSDEVVRAGVNARYSIDGGPEVPSQTNTVTDAIAGLKLTFKGVTDAPASIAIGAPGLDKAAVKEKVTAFVTAYNDLLKTTRGMLDETRVKEPKTAADASKGVLWGDTGMTTMLSRLRRATADVVGGNAATMDELREIGVSTGKSTGGAPSADAKLGLLVLDEQQLDKALEDPQAVRRMLGGLTGTDGFSQRLENVVKSYTGATGMLSARVAEGDRSLSDLQTRMTAEDDRLAAVEKRWKAQFAAMESALGTAQNQQAWLTGQITALG
jgi:flagellar hook-associated protein 2